MITSNPIVDPIVSNNPVKFASIQETTRNELLLQIDAAGVSFLTPKNS